MWWRKKKKEDDKLAALEPVIIEPIGVVRSDVKEPHPHGWEGVVSRIVLKDELGERLDGIEGYSHVLVLFWLHRLTAEQRATPKVHPRGRQDLPLLGVLATRSQYRPNPIGVSIVRLLERKGATLKVAGLDAIDGTPVLDVKPYLPPYDAIEDARMPEWVSRL